MRPSLSPAGADVERGKKGRVERVVTGAKLKSQVFALTPTTSPRPFHVGLNEGGTRSETLRNKSPLQLENPFPKNLRKRR